MSAAGCGASVAAAGALAQTTPPPLAPRPHAALVSQNNVPTLVLACALLATVLVTAGITFAHHREASALLASVKSMLPTETRVVRGGAERALPAAALIERLGMQGLKDREVCVYSISCKLFKVDPCIV